MSETVNHPAHYNTGKIEVIDAIEDWELGFHAGNVVKYAARYKHKNGINGMHKKTHSHIVFAILKRSERSIPTSLTS